MGARRGRPVGLEIEFLDGTVPLAGGGDAEWLSAIPRGSNERPQRPATTPATKWLIGLGVTAAGVGGLAFLQQQQSEDPTASPSTTVLTPPPATLVAAPPGSAVQFLPGVDWLTPEQLDALQRPQLELLALNTDSALLTATHGRNYRFDLTSFTLLTGSVAEPAPQRVVALWPGEGYLGDAADGTPVVRATDGLAYLLRADGRKTLLAEGRVDRVEFGWFAETVCIAADDCRLQLHGAAGVVTYPAHPDSRIAFSPNGEHVAIWSGTSVELIDLRLTFATEGAADDDVAVTYELGPETPLDIPPRTQTFVQTPSGGTGQQPMVWRSDSSVVGFVDDNSLVLMDAIGGKTERIPLPESAADPRSPAGG
jgi:hypothetical protein